VDASQTAGKIPIDVQAMHVDVLAFTGHKSMMGPTGIGGLYVQEGVEVRHTRAGGTGVRSAQRSHLDEYPWRLEYGTPTSLASPACAGLSGSRKGPRSTHEMRLMRRLVDGLGPSRTSPVFRTPEDHIAVRRSTWTAKKQPTPGRSST
jgi:selenocysteine lyase/cysteine desulfurase